MNADHSFLKLWGKTDRGGDPNNYHPLLFHLLDVASCAAELWKVLPNGIKARLADALGMDTQRAGTFFVFLSGLHDIGKAFPKFQDKACQFLPALKGAGFDFPDGTVFPHNFVSVPEVERLLTGDRLFSQPLTEQLARILAYALGAHHGIFPQGQDLTPIQGRALGVNPEWREARDWLADELMRAIPGAGESAPPANVVIRDLAFVPLFAAFVSLADWFGSSKFFVMRGAQEIGAYRDLSQSIAAATLQNSGWTAPVAALEAKDFAQMFAYLDKSKTIVPNALQSKVAELLQGADKPALWIIEEEMGAGKTEAAFSIFDHARVHGLATGTYIAMPTQATSNAMHKRLGEFLHNRNPSELINLILAHSHATLDEDYLKRMEYAETFTGSVYNEGMGEEDGALLVRAWFTQNKQTLLAHYGVGTIDQALLGVLQTRHWFVRLFGLAGKVVIFDEVHAYDAYMNTLLTRLIEWLAELDCTVVLLSATLPKSVRLPLANAYAKGAKVRLNAPDNQVCYPRITLVQKGEPELARAIPILKEPQRKVVSLLRRPNTPEAVKTALLQAIPGDGCAIVICNTVPNAQSMFDALKKDLEPQGWKCLLFHARTPFKWRKEKEDRVLELFGKDSGEKRTAPRGKVLLVATQVVEQSLDLDADFMASELAPVDLILQRMGRLYRHHRARNTTEPRFALLYDQGPDGLPDLSAWETIYARHTLLRSWLALRDLNTITLPTDIEPLVTQVYDQPDPTNLPEALTHLLTVASKELQEKRTKQKTNALVVSVGMQGDDDEFSDWIEGLTQTLLDDDDPETHKTLQALTRDGDPSLTVVLCGTDENGAPLAPQPSGLITPEETRQMMSFSLSLSNKAIYHALKSDKPPANWQKNAHLKHARQIVLQNGSVRIKGRELILNKITGLEIKKVQE